MKSFLLSILAVAAVLFTASDSEGCFRRWRIFNRGCSNHCGQRIVWHSNCQTVFQNNGCCGTTVMPSQNNPVQQVRPADQSRPLMPMPRMGKAPSHKQ